MRPPARRSSSMPAIAGQTITLTSGKLDIDKSLTIEGPMAGMTISGNLADRVFWIHNDVDAVLRNLTIVNGRSSFGGGIMDEGRLTLDHSLVANNEGTESGGGIYVSPGGAGSELIAREQHGLGKPRTAGRRHRVLRSRD